MTSLTFIIKKFAGRFNREKFWLYTYLHPQLWQNTGFIPYTYDEKKSNFNQIICLIPLLYIQMRNFFMYNRIYAICLCYSIGILCRIWVREKQNAKCMRVWGPTKYCGGEGREVETIGESKRVKHFSIIPNSRLCEF